MISAWWRFLCGLIERHLGEVLLGGGSIIVRMAIYSRLRAMDKRDFALKLMMCVFGAVVAHTLADGFIKEKYMALIDGLGAFISEKVIEHILKNTSRYLDAISDTAISIIKKKSK